MIISKINKIINRTLNLFNNKDVFLILLFILGSFSSFNFGKLSQIEEKSKIKIEALSIQKIQNVKKDKIEENIIFTNKSNIFASKNGKKYYYPWCIGASRIKMENRVYYSSSEEAENSGKTIAANCQK